MALELRFEDFVRIAALLAAAFEENKARLNELDAVIGDGDHGLSMARGFARVKTFAAETRDGSISSLLVEGGVQFNESAGSTIGILMLSAMREAGKVVADRDAVGLADLARMLEAAAAGIAKRGKAAEGQKTILDALLPASRVLASAGGGEAEIIRASVAAAEAGIEATKTMTAGVGRARWFTERSSGALDPGAVSGHIIVRTFADYCLARLP